MKDDRCMRHRVLVVLGLLLALGTQACGASYDCTLVGGFNGVAVEIPRVLYVATGSARIEVCDDRGCASATQRLNRAPGGPSPRGVHASFHALGRTFEPGEVTVNVQLRGARGQLVAVRRQQVRLARRHPNGKRCDGDGFVGGHLALRPGDRL
jgi:hypothetical protein